MFNELYLAQAILGCYAGSYTDYLTGPSSADYSAASTAGLGNDLTSYIPSLWAQEGLAILEENMVMANLVHRDFEASLAKFGDVVNTRKPAEFSLSRKDDGSTLVQENATAQNVQVALNQWFYKSFVIKDGEGSMAFQDLKDIYLQPAMQSIARGIDRAILGRVHAFLSTPALRVGGLGKLDYTTAKNYILDARDILNRNRAWPTARRLILSSGAETSMLKTELFIKANERGDGGNALENAILGRILGFDTYLDQNTNEMTAGYEATTFALDDGAVAAGTATLAASGATGATVVEGEFATVAGNDQPTWILHGATGVTITLNEATKNALIGGNTVTKFTAVTMEAVQRSVGYSKAMIVATHGSGTPPQVGQLIAFGSTVATRSTYTIIESQYISSTSCSILLDRPLEVVVGSGARAFPGPAGSMNLAFHRDAIALVTRPLALPNAGVQAGNASYNGIGMRVLMQYDINAGGTVVNCDILAGVAVLDPLLAVVLLG